MQQDHSQADNVGMETFRSAEETQELPVSPLNLHLPESNVIENNRVYRLPPAPIIGLPVWEQLRITVSNPNIQPEEPFNRNNFHRAAFMDRRSRFARY